MISLWASFGIHQNNAIDLTILHLNDIHARIEQTNKYLGFCKEEDVGKSVWWISLKIVSNESILTYHANNGCYY